jgi:holo-ACP synthase CitX
MDISLQALLESRDNRQAKQRALLKAYGQTLVSLTLVMPGAEKRNACSHFLARQATEAVRDALGADILSYYEYDLETGYEALFVVRTDALETKKKTCRVEDEHPLGRLFDIDVLAKDGTPLSRAAVGRPPRKCLLCEQDARTCMRLRAHPLSTLQAAVQAIIDQATPHVRRT